MNTLTWWFMFLRGVAPYGMLILSLNLLLTSTQGENSGFPREASGMILLIVTALLLLREVRFHFNGNARELTAFGRGVITGSHHSGRLQATFEGVDFTLEPNLIQSARIYESPTARTILAFLLTPDFDLRRCMLIDFVNGNRVFFGIERSVSHDMLDEWARDVSLMSGETEPSPLPSDGLASADDPA